MRSNRRHGHEEGLLFLQRTAQPGLRHARDDVRGVLPRIAHRRRLIARDLGVPVLVRVRIEQEIGPVEPASVRLVVVVD